jgi:hypothetical protein
MPSSYADAFRIIGQLLDAEAAEGMELSLGPEGITIRWHPQAGGVEARCVSWTAVERLHEQARRLRQHPFGQPSNRWAGALRTLGQELDTNQVQPTVVRSFRDGLQVWSTGAGAPAEAWYAMADLVEVDRLRRAGQDGPVAAPPGAARADGRDRLAHSHGPRPHRP